MRALAHWAVRQHCMGICIAIAARHMRTASAGSAGAWASGRSLCSAARRVDGGASRALRGAQGVRAAAAPLCR
eukprot:17324-Prymnesium_polylepis.1